jgi:putative phosphoribosyl transferase
MYFKNRAEAGRLLAAKLEKYKSQHIAVIALGLGASVVAAQVAMKLHANLLLYLIRDVNLPGEIEALAGMGSSGDTYTYNQYYSPGELEDLTGEYRSYIEQMRMQGSHELHVLLGDGGEIDRTLIRHRIVIVISDGLASGFSVDVVGDYLKTIAIKRLVIAVPVASITAVDRMHLVADEICCLSVPENYMGVDHYYDENYTPDVPGILKMMRNIAINWDRTPQNDSNG